MKGALKYRQLPVIVYGSEQAHSKHSRVRVGGSNRRYLFAGADVYVFVARSAETLRGGQPTVRLGKFLGVPELIRDTFKRQYQDVILPLAVLHRLDCVLAPGPSGI